MRAALLADGRTLRAVGFDDAPFERRRRGEVGVAGVVCAGTRFEGLVWGTIRADGWNATDVLARLRAALRRAVPSGEPVLEIGELVVDLERRLVTCRGEPVSLTPREFELLRVLAQNEGKLLTHALLLREVWGPAYQTEHHYLHVYVSQLRHKVELDPARPRYLLTEPGAGYRLVAPGAGSLERFLRPTRRSLSLP